MTYELWSFDLFDRDSEARLEASGLDLVGGFAVLCRKTLDEGLTDDGKPTFTWFELKYDGKRFSLPRDPLSNPELAKLRAWSATPGVVHALAKVLAHSPDDACARRCLALVAASHDARELGERLGHPLPKPKTKQRFDFTDSQQVEAFLASPSSSDARFITLKGPGIGDDTLVLLSKSTALQEVRFLWCDEVGAALEALTTLRLPALHTLGWCDSGVSDRGARLLGAASWAEGLRELGLSNRANLPPKRPNAIGDEGAQALASSPRLSRLEKLDLGFNPLGDPGVEALLARLLALKELVVWRTGLTQEGASRCARLARKCVVHSDFTPRTISYSEE